MEEIKIDAYTDNGNLECYTVIDKSGHNGVLMFTHEISIDFTVDKEENIKFNGAWIINCGEESTFNSEELDEFNKNYPGIWDKIVEKAKDRSNINIIDNKVNI